MMLRKMILLLLSLLVLGSSFAQETATKRTAKSRRGEAAGYSSRDATVFSMMGWGTGLAVGIATLCALLNDSEGTNGHSH
jgi:hypothetical protein